MQGRIYSFYKSKTLKQQLGYIVVCLLFLLKMNAAFPQRKIDSHCVQICPTSIDFGSRLRNHNPKNILDPSIGSSVEYKITYDSKLWFGVTAFFSGNALSETFDFNQVKTVDELKYGMKPYHNAY